MRYLIHRERKNEVEARKEYLYNTFKLWFVKIGELENFEILKSFPFNDDSILLAYGHNSEIARLFKYYGDEIKEKNIAIISCDENRPEDYHLKGRNIYLAPQRDKRAQLFCGNEYKFDFDVTEAEIRLHNCRKDEPLEKIKSVFDKIY